MLKSCIGDMTERHPGLVLQMLDVLDGNSKHAHKHSTDYVAQAQAWYLSQTFIHKLEYLRSFMRLVIVDNLSFVFKCNSGIGAVM